MIVIGETTVNIFIFEGGYQKVPVQHLIDDRLDDRQDDVEEY